jgi:hypothetical protein
VSSFGYQNRELCDLCRSFNIARIMRSGRLDILGVWLDGEARNAFRTSVAIWKKSTLKTKKEMGGCHYNRP